MQRLHRLQIEPVVRRALEEDWGYGDWTTDLCIDARKKSFAKIIAKEDLLTAGMDIAQTVFEIVDPSLRVTVIRPDGTTAQRLDQLMTIEGSSRSILKAERVALNFLGKLCGIATLARKYVAALEGTRVQLLDTRKTTPGLRLFEKSATMIAGARNHRFGLCDGVMVKENHIRSSGGITKAVGLLLESLPPTLKVEVETTNLDEVKEALAAGADIIMLDNMTLEEMTEATRYINGRALVEASGNVRLENLTSVAATGVDFVSTSAIITQAKWSDLSLLFDK